MSTRRNFGTTISIECTDKLLIRQVLYFAGACSLVQDCVFTRSSDGPNPGSVFGERIWPNPGSAGSEFGERKGPNSGLAFGEKNVPNPGLAGSEFGENTVLNWGSAGLEFGERNGPNPGKTPTD